MTDVKQLITEHLDIWLTAETEKKSGRGRSSGTNDTIYGVQKLRELIISLAIQGKLVPQQIDTDSVIELKSKINSELKSLVESNQISKKQIINISDENQPYTLPKKWMWNKLANLAVINGGYAFKSTNYSEDGIRVIRISDFDEAGLKSNNIVRHAYSETLKNFLIHPNNILMAMTGGTVGKTCFLKSIPEPLISNQRVATIKPLNCISADYVNLVLKSSLTQKVIDEAKNSTNDNISMASILNLWMPLPSLEEQQRIVAKVDELMQLCDQLEQQQTLSTEGHEQLVDLLLNALTNSADADEFQQNWQRISVNFDLLFTTDYSIEQLKQTILQLAVMGKLVKQDPRDEPIGQLLQRIKNDKNNRIKNKEIQRPKEIDILNTLNIQVPENWLNILLNDISFVTKLAGFEYTKYMDLKDEGEVPVIRAQNVKPFYLDETHLKFISLETSRLLQRCALDRNALLMTFIGAGVGDVCIFNKHMRYHLAPNVAKIEPFADCNAEYLLIFLNSPSGKEEIFKSIKATAQPSISMSTIREIWIALPPLEEQKRIVEKVNQLFSIIDQLRSLQTKARQTQLHLADVLVANAVEGA